MCHLVRVDATEALQPGSSELKDSRAHWLASAEAEADHEMGRGEEPESFGNEVLGLRVYSGKTGQEGPGLLLTHPGPPWLFWDHGHRPHPGVTA